MAHDLYDWINGIPDLIKKYWMLGIMICGVSFGGNLYQAVTKTAEKPILDKPKTVTIVNPCGKCEKEIADMKLHLQALELKRKEDMKKYHGE